MEQAAGWQPRPWLSKDRVLLVMGDMFSDTKKLVPVLRRANMAAVLGLQVVPVASFWGAGWHVWQYSSLLCSACVAGFVGVVNMMRQMRIPIIQTSRLPHACACLLGCSVWLCLRSCSCDHCTLQLLVKLLDAWRTDWALSSPSLHSPVTCTSKKTCKDWITV